MPNMQGESVKVSIQHECFFLIASEKLKKSVQMSFDLKTTGNQIEVGGEKSLWAITGQWISIWMR